jgi:hypothetical protein
MIAAAAVVPFPDRDVSFVTENDLDLHRAKRKREPFS